MFVNKWKIAMYQEKKIAEKKNRAQVEHLFLEQFFCGLFSWHLGALDILAFQECSITLTWHFVNMSNLPDGR